MDETIKQESGKIRPKGKVWKLSLAAIVVIALGFIIYLSQYYPTESIATDVLGSSVDVQVTTYKNFLVFSSTHVSPREGIIFYPERKVEYTAYAPMMNMMASQGFLCVLAKMPLNHPSFDKDTAKVALEKFEFITDWYIAGHGNGGEVAAEFASKNPELFKGVILAGSYSKNNLSDSGLRVLTLYGTEDLIMGIDQYNTYKENLPTDTVEVVMEGGNHSSFGYYGDHKKDGEATISKYQQQAFSAIHILSFITGEEVKTTLEELGNYGK